jgi:hypothetical protein
MAAHRRYPISAQARLAESFSGGQAADALNAGFIILTPVILLRDILPLLLSFVSGHGESSFSFFRSANR